MQKALSEQIELELCMRAFAPEKIQRRQQDILDRIQELDEGDVVDDVTLTWWGRKVCAPSEDGDDLDDRCPDVVTEILSLQEDDELELEPYIEKHERGRTNSSPVLFLPVITLLVRTDGEIRGIYPVTYRETEYTIEHGLGALEAGESGTNLA